MSKISKIVVIVGMIILFFVLFSLIIGVRESGGHSTPGILGIILFVGLIAGIRAVWKYNVDGKSTNEERNDNDYTLKK